MREDGEEPCRGLEGVLVSLLIRAWRQVSPRTVKIGEPTYLGSGRTVPQCVGTPASSPKGLEQSGTGKEQAISLGKLGKTVKVRNIRLYLDWAAEQAFRTWSLIEGQVRCYTR